MIFNTFVRYLAVGVANTVFGYGAILVMQLHFGFHPVLANTLGYTVGLLLSYALNRKYTFRSQRDHSKSAPIFIVAAGVCFAINILTLQFSINILELPATVSQALAILTYTILFYVANRYLVFNSSKR